MWQFIKDTWDRYWNEEDPVSETYPVISTEVIWRHQQITILRAKRDKARGQKKKHTHFERDIKTHRTWLLERGL